MGGRRGRGPVLFRPDIRRAPHGGPRGGLSTRLFTEPGADRQTLSAWTCGWSRPERRGEAERYWRGTSGRAHGEGVVVAAFEEAIAQLADEFGGDDPSEWRTRAWVQRYQRLNADLPGDLLRTTSCDVGFCPGPFEPTSDSGMPGDIPEHIYMDRGTYNHVVAYLDPPSNERGKSIRRGQGGAGKDQTPLGLSRVHAGSVIPPGQSGFINLAGQEDRHFQDQLDLYVTWLYKPMPLAFDDAMRLATRVETLTYERE